MRGFSDDERERIRTRFIEAGRKLFSQYGIGKTTIADLTGEVGIGTSTFYQFYDSKEELYLAVLEDEGEDIAERMAAEGFFELDDPRETVEQFLRFVMDEIETNPLTRQLLVGDNIDRIRDQQSPADRREERQQDIDFVLSFLGPFIEDGRVFGQDPEIIASAVVSIPYLTLHQEDIGTERYPEVRDYVIESFARGMVREGHSAAND
ncbi:TetR/AcrR family transcriptional regulator [Haloferax namakaokahaiae]|uniref:TetR/AcrR family transcriptional regulator n=1 Tax=Haloferax namakaokahaiae TaxID=1748331 RepID=A0ABD5ZDQ9_9EURY